MNKAIPYILATVVALTAVAYFSLTAYRTINPVDEGYVLHNYQKAAEGQIPHRDFHDNYGPAIYWLGGGLFKAFGSRLIVMRVFVLALKSAMALMIFLIARKLLPPAFALLAAALFILSWGNPYFPAFNILYAGFVTHFFALAGMLFMIAYVERGKRLWLLGAAACLGASALFKFHSAVFDFIGFSIFLSLKEHALGLETGDGAHQPAIDSNADTASRLPRAVKMLGAPLVAVFYLTLFARDHLDFYYFFLFLFPFFLILGHIFATDLASLRSAGPSPTSAANLKNCYIEILLLLSGPVVFLAFELLYYYAVNGLDELMFDTFTLPMAMKFYMPLENYRMLAGIIAAGAVLILTAMRIAKRLGKMGESAGGIFWGLCLALLLLLPAMMALTGTPFEAWRSQTIYLVPPITLLLTSYILITSWRRERLAGMTRDKTLLLGLVFIFACQGFIVSFPRTDTAHIQINSTVIFTLISFLIWKAYAGWSELLPGGGRVRAAIFAAACAAMLAAPFLWSMKTFRFLTLSEQDTARLSPDFLRSLEERKSYPTLDLDFPRSAGLSIPMWWRRPLHDFFIVDTYKIIDFLRRNTEADERILVLCESQIVYFLAERESIFGKEDYFLYLASVGLIDNADDVRLSDEQFVKRLAEAKPRFILEAAPEEQTRRIYAVWPEAAAFIEENYETAQTFGGVYHLLQYRATGSNL